eukprot:1451951-Prymnesium_polylepis.1
MERVGCAWDLWVPTLHHSCYIQFTLCKIGSCNGMHFVYRTGGANTSVTLGRSVHCVLRIVYSCFSGFALWARLRNA